MKDRVKRTGYRKPNHRLKIACIAISCFTMVFGGVTTALLVTVNQQNEMLSKSIDNYTTQIDLLEEQDNVLLKFGNE